jgi:hypothetical protein
LNDLAEARAQGDLFMQRAYRKAVDDQPSFGDMARAFIVAYLATHGPTSGEILTNACKRAGIKARDDRAMGGVYQKLIRDRSVVVLRSDLPRFRGHGSAGARLYGLVQP